ncbi:hypothetical protein MMC25_006224 [Agyrium rufum]|nr:hypothetical protein [Agyrium rufum]
MPTNKVHETTLRLRKPLSTLKLAAAWTVLLKDYVGSSAISFLLTDLTCFTGPCTISKVIALTIDEKETLGQLREQIEVQLSLCSGLKVASQPSSFRSHLCISLEKLDAFIDDDDDDDVEERKERKGVKSVEKSNHSFRATRIDFEIRCIILECENNVRITVSPKSAASSSTQAFRISQQFARVLGQVDLPTVEGKVVHSMETASESDLRSIWKWNLRVPKVTKQTVLDVFLGHVKSRPNARAVDAWDGDLRYLDLDELSTTLSVLLVHAGVRRGNIVPLCFEKSKWTAVAILAVVKTGAAFVLLDENLPPERLRQLSHIVARETILVLTSAAQQHRATQLAYPVMVVGPHLLEITGASYESVVEAHVEASDLIYIVFTSGTTGTPKAAMIRHSNVCAFVSSVGSLSAVTSGSRIVALASYAYDVSLGNIFLSLLSGACLCIPSSWECKNDVARIVRNYQITHAQMTPSVSKMIPPSETPSLEVLDLCGELCSEDAIARWRGSRTRVMNTYSPAECTVTSVANENVLCAPRPAVIGRGLGACWVMDPINQARLSPVGGIGELVLEGPLVGFGYLGDQDSTLAAFIENPEWLLNGLPSVSPGRRGRLYRTGDLVRYTDDGQIEYIGRRDLQVKIRGQRVELGELGAHLHELISKRVQWCPGVARLKNGSEVLLIYLVPPPGRSNEANDVFRTTVDLVHPELRRRLPPVMVPSAYAWIDNIPLSLTGKTDHRELKKRASSLTDERLLFPQPGSVSSFAVSYVANGVTKVHTNEDGQHDEIMHNVTNDISANGRLETLKNLWGEVLRVDSGSIQSSDSFFSHGGESLTAIKLVGAAARKGIQIDVATIFKYPQLSALASRCKLALASCLDLPKPFSLLENQQILPELAMCCDTYVENIEDAYPCTPMQEGLLIANNQRTATYTGQGIFKLPKHIDTERLTRAWKHVATNHSILRTRIVETAAYGFLQVVLKDNKPFSGEERANLADYLKDDVKEMGLGTQLCRWSLVREPVSTYLVLTMHHAIYDGWTLQRIGTEVFRAYQGVRLQPAMGSSVFIHYLTTLPQEPAREYWAHQFTYSSNTNFFPAIPHPDQIPKADSELSKMLCGLENAHCGISIPSLLRAAWALLVAKLSGSNDVTFGVTVSGRNVPIKGIEDLLSPTISTIPVRVKLDGAETMERFVARIQNEALGAMPFEHIGLQNIRKINSDTREGSKFQTLFIVHPPDAATLGPASDLAPDEQDLKTMLEALDISTSLSNFNEYALMVLITQRRGNLVIQASYDSNILGTFRVELLLDQFTHLAKQIGCQDNLGRSLRTLNFASESDLEAIWKWNSMQFPGEHECIHDMIARTMSDQPDLEAICAWDGSFRFRDVDRLSSELAQILRRKGVLRGSYVPILMEKSKWNAVAMVGIMRAGAGFIAIDVRRQPQQRIQTILREVEAQWVVSAGSAAALAQRISKGVILCDHLREDESFNSHTLPGQVSVSPSDTAFVVFTSGSTGVPKGIIITHENFCTTIEYHKHELQLSRTSRIYDYASYSFDIAVHNALMALTLGGCLCVPSEDDRENDIEGSFERLKANWTNLTPSVARLVDPPAVPGLQVLVLSGEAVSKDLILQWAERAELINAYGPAECQICTVQRSLRSLDDSAKIGRGVGCLTWIVDPESKTLSPIGALGELLIEGPIVSPGYLNAPCDAFIQDPTWLLKGSPTAPGRAGRLYRTGDLARYQADGTILYAGRATTQTKINGQRIELGEIEFHIRRICPTLRDIVADVIDIDGVSLLCAFLLRGESENALKSNRLEEVSLSTHLAAPPIGLQERLKDVVPGYMIPTIFLNISRVPLTINRKVDRQKLKESATSISKDEILALRHTQEIVEEHEMDEQQQRMRHIWSQVLKLEPSKISLSSDFFQLGGDSISAMNLVKSSRKHGLSFTVTQLFRQPRLNELLSIACKHTNDEDCPSSRFNTVQPYALVPDEFRDALIASAATSCKLVSDDILDIYPCTPFQEGVFTQTISDPSAYVQHTEIRVTNGLSIGRVLAGWNSVIASNAILRTRIIQSKRAHLLQVVVRETQEWPVYKSSKDYLINAAKTPMSLGGPLSRFALVCNRSTPSPEYVIIWSIHHALYDAWTVRLILHQVSSHYLGQENVNAGPAYNIFVQFIQGIEVESQNWWKLNLSGAAGASVFPRIPMTDGATLSRCTKRKDIELPQVLPPGYTLGVLLRTTWSILMARHTESESILFGEIRFGRNIPIEGVERIQGPTIALVPIFVHVNREQTVGALLNSIRETDIQMQEFDHLGLQSMSRLSEDAKAACKFQTLLVLQEHEDKIDAENSIFRLDNTIDDIRNFSSWGMMIVFHRKRNGLVAEAVFNECAISADLVELLLQQTQAILSSLCAMPTSTNIQQLDLTNEDDLTRIWNWNGIVPETVDEFLHEVVARQAQKNPERIAVLAHDGQATYKELDRFSSNLASQLVSRGIGIDSFVPLCFEKSFLVPIAMLAVIKTGAAFTVMDVSYPESRLKAISSSLNAQIVLASSKQQELAGRLADDVFIVDHMSYLNTCDTGRKRMGETLSQNTSRTMYVCFTSGSTGMPKGVLVAHNNLASAAITQVLELGFGPGDRVYDFCSHAFDMHIWHTWIALVSGACLCIPSDDDRMGNLAGSMSSFQTTVAWLTPSVARTVDPREIPTVKRLFLGGESVTPFDVSMWIEHVELWETYGPTETTPLSMFARPLTPDSAANIGKGFGVTTWICNPDDHHKLMAIGGVGELVLEGPLVCRGYHNQPDRTAAVFIEDPEFLTRGSVTRRGRRGKLYKTGDLVRYSFDGTIEYMGRADTQVKLRGQRMELGEVEYHLKNTLSTTSSIVCEIVTHPSGRPMLVAFCASFPTTHVLDRIGARTYLSKVLPPYMIPEAFFPVPEIPTTPSGKLDRKRLKAMAPSLLQSLASDEVESPSNLTHGPLTQMESRLETLWTTVITWTEMTLCPDSDFFDVGGDSIAAMKLSNLARQGDFCLAIKDIIRNPKLSLMALCIQPILDASDCPSPFSMVESSRLKQVLTKAASICGIGIESISDIYPCTPLQIELFALTMKQPEAYLNQSIFDIPSQINTDKLVRAWNTVVGINAVLRTRFVDIEGLGLLQVVLKDCPWETYDNFPAYLATASPKTDLGSPLSQLAIILEENAPKIVWTIHHALYDGWSVQLIGDQLRKAYCGEPIPRPPAFSEFVQYLISQDLQEARKFWRLRLVGCSSSRMYPIVPSINYQVKPCKTFKRTLETTIPTITSLQAIIHAAWALIASKLSENDDVVFAATLAGRTGLVAGIEQMVGPTIAPVPIRVQLENRNQSVRELLSKIEKDTAEMAPYQHFGTKRIELVNSDTRAACGFQTLIVVTPPNESFQGPDVISTSTHNVNSEERAVFHTFPLILFFTPTSTGFALEIIYDPIVLHRREIERLSGRLESVINTLGQCLINEGSIADVDCLGKEDLDDIWSWNSALPTASEQLLHDIVLSRTEYCPEKLAIDAWDCKISYSRVKELSRNLEKRLRKQGVGRGSVIPILSPKSGYVPLAALAVLRAGASFLPLDAAQPLNRLKAIVHQVKPDVILAASSVAEVALGLGAAIVYIEECLKVEFESSECFAGSHQTPQPDDVACILFTSGSTGIPKGVLQTHRALSSAIAHQATKSGFTEETRAFEFASYSFDVSWNMIFKVLAVGGTLCVPSGEERQNDLIGALNRSAATLTELTASVARLINPNQLSTLKTLIMSGEFADLRDFEHWRPRVELIVCYGPSECTSVSTMNLSLQDSSNGDGIGKGISCITWIVDPQNHRRLMPVGAIGEILIEGPIVGKGYYQNDRLTSASYVSDLPWLEAGHKGTYGRSSIAFKSGDLARYDSNGNLHFISRKDTQIKLHGQRIELEEVQHHVKTSMGDLVGPVVACVLGDPGVSSEQTLAAFLSCEDRTTASFCTLKKPTNKAAAILETLDENLRALLPMYMIPAVYYFVTSIPCTTNGKIDRKKLGEVGSQAQPSQAFRGRPDHHSIRRSPSTLAEVKMQQFWSVALGVPVESVGADDNFFNLNGDSISAMRLVAGARNEGYTLRVADVFATPRLSDLALKLQLKETPGDCVSESKPFDMLGDSVDVTGICLEVAAKCDIRDPSMVEDVYPCSPLQESMLAATIKDPRAFTSMRLYRIPQEIDLCQLQNAWTVVVARNRILRTRLVDLKGRGLKQAVVQGSPLWDTYSSVQSFLANISKQNMGLGTLLTRWAIIKEPEERRLVWTIHHTVYDGWILPVIEDEVRKVYFGHALMPPQPDMKLFVKYLLEQGKESAVDFWREELKEANESMIYPSLPNHSYVPRPDAHLEKCMSADISSLPPGINLSALVYGSWSLLVSRITGNNRVALGAILTGRTAPIDGIDNIMGPTITTAPIMVDVDLSLSVQEYLNRLRENTGRMIPHEHLGIHAIGRISASSAAACSFQTVLVVQPPTGTKDSPILPCDQLVMEELDETKVDGFPNQHAVLNQYGLMMEILPNAKDIIVRASFDPKLISTSQIDRMINQWEFIVLQLSQMIIQAPLTPLRSLDPMCPRDVGDVWMWNEDILEINEDFVHQIISETSSLQPKALAIDAWDGQLTYCELDILSSRLAERLIQSGVGPGCFVPLIFQKSMWANVSMLAVSKAGGAFVPLDADHPEGRLRAAMQLLGAEIILCSAGTRDRAARLAPCALMVDGSLRLDDNRNCNGTDSIMPVTYPKRGLQAKDLAYAVFTSGSTGAAKGVKISHTNLATAIRHQAGTHGLQLDTGKRTLDSSSYSFDACIFNFFYTLTQGGCLCVPCEDSLKGDIGKFMSEYKVNWAQLVPSVARTITPGAVPDLKSLVLTGEALTQGDINTWSHRVHLVNVYGPTECTILCAISPQVRDSTQVGNIGRGRGANLWLTEIGNPNRLAPVGAIGEILIEGPIIGAGYLGPYHYPLVIDPPWLIAGTKHSRGRRGVLFQTGDQARYTENGSLVFIGRIGSEVKLRGQRVDLMEVEDIVRRHDPFSLEFAADIVHVDWGGNYTDRQILLMYVSDSSANRLKSTCTPDDLCEKLRTLTPDLKRKFDATLPSYLHPEAFVPLASMPKTSSGKTDRRRLKSNSKQLRSEELIWISASMVKTSSAPPSTQEEQMLAALWAEVLGIDPLSIAREDDFFLLGGDSLGVMRLTTAAHEHNILLRSRDVFEDPRLQRLAKKMNSLEIIPNEVIHYRPYSLVKDSLDLEALIEDCVKPSLNVQADQIEDIIPANGFQVDYMNSKEEPLGLQYAYLDISSKVSWPKLVDACRAVVQTFQCLRARFVHHEGKYYQVILRDAPLLTEELVSDEQLTTFSNQFCGRDCRQAVLTDIYTKLSLVDRGCSKRRVILRMSHMQNDGWSQIRILKAIASVFSGDTLEKTTDWTHLLSYRLRVASESRRYWRSILQDVAQITPPLIFNSGGTKVRTLRTLALSYFHSLGDNRRTRPTVVVNVAWALVLQQLAGHDEVVFGNVTTGRNGAMPSLHSVVGPCVNMLPVRLHLSANTTSTGTRQQQLRDLVEASAQQVDDRTAFEGLDWEDMVDQCTTWPSGTRYSSAVHFRNMAFEPELALEDERLVVGWYELVATPHWTTVLVYPEDDVLRLWLLANPAEIGDNGADEILHMLAGYVNEIMSAI